MSEHTEQDTSSRRLWSNVLISMFRNKRAKKGFRGTQLETTKLCDFLFLAFLRILAVYYDDLFDGTNQSEPLFFIDVFKECNQGTPFSLTDQQKPL